MNREARENDTDTITIQIDMRSVNIVVTSALV